MEWKRGNFVFRGRWIARFFLLRGGAEVARQAHNLKVVGSIPTPATISSRLFISPYLIFCMSYYCYILKSQTSGKHYIGVTEDVARRLEQHNNGLSKWTKGKGPWELLWQCRFHTLSEARKFENLLKRQKGGFGFYRLTGLKKGS